MVQREVGNPAQGGGTRDRQRVVVSCADIDALHFASMTDGRVALAVPSRRRFTERRGGRYAIDG